MFSDLASPTHQIGASFCAVCFDHQKEADDRTVMSSARAPTCGRVYELAALVRNHLDNAIKAVSLALSYTLVRTSC